MTDPVQEPFLGYYPSAELVFAVVCPLGTEHQAVAETLENYLGQFGYKMNLIRVSKLFESLFERLGEKWEPPKDRTQLADYKIEAGNTIRKITEQKDILARVSAGMIAARRSELTIYEKGDTLKPLERTAHVITTLKRPEEVTTLRGIYGNGFFLIGLSSSKSHRDRYFAERGMESAAQTLIEKDAAESVEYGQLMRETFHLADVFIPMDDYSDELGRFLDLVFGKPTITPTADEQAMFTAYATSLRSGDLSRQVGAAIMDRFGDLLSVGCNEAPKSGGGLYGPEENPDRDIERGVDSNEIEKTEMIGRMLQALDRKDLDLNVAKQLLRPTGFTDITEFGRAVHAEMEALLACARTGRSPRDGTLYATTFPCHNCCRHIVAAGLKRVVYVEPYAKSKASVLHRDAISVDEELPHRVPFVPFIGIGPRRYFDLFSLKLSTGYPVERKIDGKLKTWDRSSAAVRLQLQPISYLGRESLAWASVKTLLS